MIDRSGGLCSAPVVFGLAQMVLPPAGPAGRHPPSARVLRLGRPVLTRAVPDAPPGRLGNLALLRRPFPRPGILWCCLGDATPRAGGHPHHRPGGPGLIAVQFAPAGGGLSTARPRPGRFSRRRFQGSSCHPCLPIRSKSLHHGLEDI